MISTTKTGIVESTKEKNYVKVELIGLSTDIKPTQIGNNYVGNGSQYIEMDTGKIYFYDLENEQWKEF